LRDSSKGHGDQQNWKISVRRYLDLECKERKEELTIMYHHQLVFYICERGWVVAGPYSLCWLRETAAKAVVQNSNLIGKMAVREIKNLCGKKE
jgi:replicative superfamily II helicase